MSFEIVNFSPVGGQAMAGNSPGHWSYESAVDDLAAAQASGYFDEVGTQVSPGDFISVSLIDGKAILTVDSTVLSPPAVVIDTDSIGAGPEDAAAFPVEFQTFSPLELAFANNLTFFVIDTDFTVNVEIPNNSTHAFPIGAEMHFEREGTGDVTFTTFSPAVLQSRNGLVNIKSRYSAAALKKIDTDEWRLIGNLA